MKSAILTGLLVTVAVTTLFWMTDLDIRLQSLAYRGIEPHWPYASRQPWQFLHDFGTIPGVLLALAATVMLGSSLAFPSAARWRYPSLYLFLLLVLGPGLITNVFGKVLCGRPRPDEILQFGGSAAFHRPFQLGTPGQGFSFLCGHCSMGFLFLAFFFLLRGWKRWVALAGSIAFGLFIGAGRVIQAAHFPSDVLLDGSIMFTLAAALSPIAAVSQMPRIHPSRWQVAVGTAISIVFLVFGFLFSTPVHKEHVYQWIASGAGARSRPHQTNLPWKRVEEVTVSVEKGRIDLRLTDQNEPLQIHSSIHGFGLPGAGVKTAIEQRGSVLEFHQRMDGLYWESHGAYEVTLPRQTQLRIQLASGEGEVYLRRADLSRSVRISGSFDLVDPDHLLTHDGGNRHHRPGFGNPLILSIRANRVVVR